MDATIEQRTEGDNNQPGLLGQQVEASLLESKLCPPPTHVSLVRRTDLERRLAAAGPASITVVAAPAGYGKTSLVSSYASSLKDGALDDGSVAWVSLDADDGDTVKFWSYVAAAVQRACHREPDPPGLHGPGTGIDVEQSVIPRLLNSLHFYRQPVTIILDDLHHVDGEHVWKQLAVVAERLPGNCRLVLATRCEPELPLARWRVRGSLNEIRADDLAFTRSETSIFLNRKLDLDLSDHSVAMIRERSEGWPAGIYLASLGLRGRENRDELAQSSSSGFNRATVEYMTSEVLAAIAPSDRHFLARLSVLERFNCSLAEAVSGAPDGSKDMISTLAKENLFISSADSTWSWFRIHTTLRNFLTAELELTEPELVAELHARAVEWYVDNGHVAEALSHAAVTANHQLVAELVRDHWIELVDSGHLNVLSKAVEVLRNADLVSDAGLMIAAAWTGLHTGADDELERDLADASRLGAGAVEQQLAELVAAARDLANGSIPDAFDAALPFCAIAEAPASDVARLAVVLAGTSAVWAGELDAAEPLLRSSLADGDDDREPVRQAALRGHLALALAERQEFTEARTIAEAGLRSAKASGVDEWPQAAMLHTALGVIGRRDGSTEDAIGHLERGVRAARRSHPVSAAYALLNLSGAVRRGGDLDRARLLVAEGRELLAGCDDPGELVLKVWDRDSRSLRRRSFGGDRLVEELTERELEHLHLLPTELTRREIAERLMVSYNTVKSNSRAIFRKLGANSRDEAVARAREAGLI